MQNTPQKPTQNQEFNTPQKDMTVFKNLKFYTPET